MNKNKYTIIKYISIIIIVIIAYLSIFYFNTKYIYSQIISILSVIIFIFFIDFEKDKPKAINIICICVMTSIAVVGRILFFSIPQFKPTSAIIITSGILIGKKYGFLIGALSGFISNFFFGQGPWTIFQMFAWGITGYISGFFYNKKIKNNFILYLFSFIMGYVYGFIVNLMPILSLGENMSILSVTTTIISGFYFDSVHAFSNVIFMIIIYKTIEKRVLRIKNKYNII